MDQSASGLAPAPVQQEQSEHVALDVVNYGNAASGGPVTRRRALRGGAAALVGAAVAVAGAADAGEAFASTRDKKKAKKKPASSASKKLTINVNGKNHVVRSSPDTMLLYVLRNEVQLHGLRFGCGLSQCGACAVLLNGKQIRSCVTPVAGVADVKGNNKITTTEGLPALWKQQRHGAKTKAKKGHAEAAAAPALHPVQQAWIDVQVPQCGYCQTGMMIQAVDLLSKHARPTEAQIKTAMNGHLCRCGTYTAIIEAIQEAGKTMAKELA